jgi:molybdenum-dependent DNA-binding transcriptional regulator ModE
MRPRNWPDARSPLPLDPGLRRTGWQVEDADGDVIYRGTDAELAHEIYHALPGGHLRLLTNHPPERENTQMINRPKTLDLALVRAFVHTTDTGSITAAAPGLGYTQPGLSQRIQALERILGHRLLVRGPNGVHPTPAGRTALLHARTLLATAETLHHDLATADHADPETPDLTG